MGLQKIEFLIVGILFLSGCVTAVPFGPVGTVLQCRDSVPSFDGIVGGSEVGYGDPDQKLVTMLKIRRVNAESVCTGTLISDRVILTAAHCVEGTSPGDITPQFVTSEGCPVNQNREMLGEVISQIIHRGFDGNPQSLSDLALLYLAEDAPKDQQRLPVLRKDEKVTSDKILLIGYGITNETKKDSQILRRIYKSLRIDITPHGRALIVDQSKEKGGFCRGDSGAPIIGEIWGEPYIIAINSANVGIQPNKECQTLSLAMDATEFSDWILRNKQGLESSTWIGRLFSESSTRAE